MAITWWDPADIRNSFCFVRGCTSRIAVACCVDRRHGRIAHCADHNPAKYGDALPFPTLARRPVAVGLDTAPTSKPDIGPMPPVRPFGPSDPTPPAPGGASIPTFNPAPARVAVPDLEF